MLHRSAADHGQESRGTTRDANIFPCFNWQKPWATFPRPTIARGYKDYPQVTPFEAAGNFCCQQQFSLPGGGQAFGLVESEGGAVSSPTTQISSLNTAWALSANVF